MENLINYMEFKMKKNSLFLMILLCLIFTKVNSQTYIKGGVYSNTNWTADKSPYIITDTVVIFKEVTLTVESGVSVLFENSKLMIVRGTLVTTGNQENPVVFSSTSQEPKNNRWKGIIFEMESNADINYTEFSYASVLLNMHDAYGKKYSFKNSQFFEISDVIKKSSGRNNMIVDSCTFERNIYVSSYQCRGVILKNSTIRNNKHGFSQIYESQILNCDFYDNEVYALYLAGGKIEYNTFINNGLALINWLGDNHSFQYNIVLDNDIGIQIGGAPRNYTIANNMICNNKMYNAVNGKSENFNISNNCWCLKDSSEIRSTISDGYNDVSKGLLYFTPFWDSCNENDSTFTSLGSINNIELYQTNLDLYPIPTTDIINVFITAESSTSISINIFNIFGETIFKLVDIPFYDVGEFSIPVDVSSLNPGVYYCTMYSPQGIITKSFMVMR